MKKTTNFCSSILKPVAGLLALTLAFSACKKDDNPYVPGIAALAIVHAAPGTPELTFKIDGTKSNVKALTFGTVQPYGNIAKGTYAFSVTKKDSSRILANATTPLRNGKAYSLFIADVPTKTAFTVIEDDLTAPAADKANVRFVNMSPDAGSLDLLITGQTTPLFTKTAFKGATSFASLTPGAELNFEIRENTKTEVLTKIEKVKIEKNKIYTIWAKGLKAATDSTKLTLALITNK
jgi:hypothetical protein